MDANSAFMFIKQNCFAISTEYKCSFLYFFITPVKFVFYYYLLASPMFFRCFCLDSFDQSRPSTCGALQELWRENTRRDSRAKRVNREKDANICGSQVLSLSEN